MRKLEEIVRGTNVLILSDEVYEHMVYDGAPHESVSRYPELAQRSFVVSSFGKTYHVTGWKVGYVAAPAALTAEFRKVHQFNVFTVNTPMQIGLARLSCRTRRRISNLPAFYQKKRDFFRAGLANSRFKLLPCDGHVLPVRRLFGDQRSARSRIRAMADERDRRRGHSGLGVLSREPTSRASCASASPSRKSTLATRARPAGAASEHVPRDAANEPTFLAIARNGPGVLGTRQFASSRASSVKPDATPRYAPCDPRSHAARPAGRRPPSRSSSSRCRLRAGNRRRRWLASPARPAASSRYPADIGDTEALAARYGPNFAIRLKPAM